jgi:hypothetical protein
MRAAEDWLLGEDNGPLVMASAAKPSIFSDGENAKVEQERSAFLKERTKKLLLLYSVLVQPPVAHINKSFFASPGRAPFFAKRADSYFRC